MGTPGNGRTINGLGAGVVFEIESTVVDIVFDNMIITGGSSFSNGGGVRISGSNGTAVFNRVTFKDNTASNQGGGLYIVDKAVLITDSVITGNTAATGAGIYSINGQLEINSTIISSNVALGNGDGVYLNAGSADFIGCVFAGHPHTDVYSPSCGSAVAFYSACGEDEYNAGVDTLLYSCAEIPQDLSGRCLQCPTGQSSCCGSLECSIELAECTDLEISTCPK